MKILLAAALAAWYLYAQEPVSSKDSPTIPKLAGVNPEILSLVIWDQWDRGNDMFTGRQVRFAEKLDVEKRDQQRRDALRKLIAEGKLQTGKDYQYAALMLQHSPDSAGYLLAHVLAVTAVGKGEVYSKWLAAATMDRYLQSLNKPQVFGTQFKQLDGNWTIEPYDRTVISDAVRAAWCVVPLLEQEAIVKDARDGKPLRGTAVNDCK